MNTQNTEKKDHIAIYKANNKYTYMKAILYIALHRIYNRWSQLLITVGYCATARMRK